MEPTIVQVQVIGQKQMGELARPKPREQQRNEEGKLPVVASLQKPLLFVGREDDDRLGCFDALAAETTHAVATAPPPTDALAAPAAAVAVARSDSPPAEPAAGAVPEAEPISDEVGLSRIKGSNTPEPQQYSATVTKCEENKQSGQYYFFLENGQVWQQSQSGRLVYRAENPRVVIKRGMLGGYYLSVDGVNRRVRVKRLK